MLAIASEIVIYLLLAALIGFALGYLVGKNKSEKPNAVIPSEPEGNAEKEEVEKEDQEVEERLEASTEKDAVVEETNVSEDIEIPTENAIEKALEALGDIEEQEVETALDEAVEGQKPELLSAPRNGEKDNLTDIKGIGPKVEEKLNASGIYHFEQIANWTEENMIWLEAHTLFASRAKKELWIEESKSLL